MQLTYKEPYSGLPVFLQRTAGFWSIVCNGCWLTQSLIWTTSSLNPHPQFGASLWVDRAEVISVYANWCQQHNTSPERFWIDPQSGLAVEIYTAGNPREWFVYREDGLWLTKQGTWKDLHFNKFTSYDEADEFFRNYVQSSGTVAAEQQCSDETCYCPLETLMATGCPYQTRKRVKQ